MANDRKQVDLILNTEVKGGESVDQTVEKVKTLKQQLKEAKLEVEQFEEGSEGFIRASQNVAQLSDKLDDINDQVKLLKGDALERVASGFKGVGSAILDLDAGKLKLANESLKGIKFGDLIKNAGDFGKELFKLATNPFFLIPAAIGLIIANFDKLLKIFPGLGAVVNGVKAIFDKVIEAVTSIINYAGELYEEFKPIINVLFPITGLVEGLIDLIKEQGETAEAQAKRSAEAEAKYKDSIEKSNQSLGESRRRILVATGQLSQEEANRQKAKEDFITNYLKAQEEARLKIKEAGSAEEKAVIKKDLDLRLKALQDEYTATLVEINKGEKDKNTAKAKADADAKKAAADKAKAAREKEAADNLKDTEAFNQKLVQAQSLLLSEKEKIDKEAKDKEKALQKAFDDLTIEEKKTREKELQDGLAAIREDAKKKKDAIDKAEEEKQKAKDKAAQDAFLSTLTANADARLTAEEAITNEGNNRKLELQRQFDALSNEEQILRKQQFDDEIKAIDKETKDALDEQAKVSAENQKRIEEDLNSKKVDAVKNGLSTISNLVTLFTGKSKKEQEKAFRIQKAVAIAQASIDTAQAANAAYKALAGIPVIGPGLGVLAAAAAITAGLANVKKIREQTFDGGGPDPVAPPPPDNINSQIGSINEGPGGISALPTFNLRGQQLGGAGSILGDNGGSQAQQPIKVYVTESDISNVQGKVQVIQGNSLFGSGG